MIPLIFFIFHSTIFSQNPVTIKFHPSVKSDEVVEINVWHKGKFSLISSIQKGDNDSIVVNEFHNAGLYNISFKNFKNAAEFIYNPNEKMQIELDMNLANGQLIIDNSLENKCYSDLIKINDAYNHFLDSLLYLRREISINTNDYYGRCFYLDSLFETVAREKNGRLTYLQYIYNNTYTSKILVPLSLIPVITSKEEGKVYQTPYSYLANHYFKYLVNDSEILNHYLVENSIMEYLSKYSLPGKDGIKKSIDYIMKSFETDSVNSNYISTILVKTFIDAKAPDLALYVMGSLSSGCELDLGQKQAEYLSNFSHVQIGNAVDDIVLNDINSQPVSLSNTCKKYNYTLLIFWTSWCKHCEDFLPELNSKLTKYSNKISVFAVSLDENETQWKSFVDAKKINNWVHVSELKRIEQSSYAPRFMITHTPSIFLLDKNRKIITKDLKKEEWGPYLDKLFK